jgi:hypothetical protein
VTDLDVGPGVAKARAESLVFIANEIGAVVDTQLATADGLDLKIGGVLALSVAGALTYFAIVALLVLKLDATAIVAGAVALLAGVGCWTFALRGLSVQAYRRWPNAAEYAKLATSLHTYDVADLAKQAATEKAKDFTTNKDGLVRKARRLRWSLAFVAIQLAGTMFSLLRAVIL